MKKRLIYDKILAERNSKKVSIIIGPRQVGKTTILKALQKELGGIFFDADIFSEYSQVSTYENCIATLKTRGYQENQKDFFFVFFDEFQRYPDLSMVMKSVYDHHDNIKIYATGSSSLQIKNSVQESLAGRKNITNVWPLNFEEFLYFKEREDILERVQRLDQVVTDDYFLLIPEARTLLEEFLIFGGYPEVVLSITSEAKQEVLRSIFDLYIKKDFAEYVKIEKLRNAAQLLRVLAINHGQSANFAKYATVSEINVETVKNYISVLEETFIIFSLRPYFTNKNKEISKMPKIYFLDNGVRNYFGGGFSELTARNDSGFLFEAFVISEMVKKGMDVQTIKYYRTKSGEEVDIILERDNQPLLPIEVKFKKTPGTRDISPIKRFIEKNSLPEGLVVTAGLIKKIPPLAFLDCFVDIPAEKIINPL
jgi:hypothetical protein